MKIKALLLDLDGTLLHHDINTFLPRYFSLLVKKFSALIEPNRFKKCIFATTEAMMKNNEPDRTNQEVFWDNFLPLIGLPKEELYPLFNQFYQEDFPNLKGEARADQQAHALIQLALKNGLKIVIATNAVFPRTAIIERLRWAGLAELPYTLITSYENMHFCKPNPNYFLEIAEKIGEKPSHCLMVGNDLELDLIPAASIGMKTFLTETYQIPSPSEFKPDFVSSLGSLLEMLKGKSG
jgi:HAD superfamily hydrolase (TIGR01549 family)